MFDIPPLHRIPRAHRDPIRSPFDALRLVWASLDSDPRHQTVVVTLDAERCGLAVMLVNDTADPDAFLGLVDSVTEAAVVHPEMAALIVATVRPDGGFDVDDLARWHEADETCDESGLELVEWFVVGAAVSVSVSCPRQLCGVPSRWAA